MMNQAFFDNSIQSFLRQTVKLPLTVVTLDGPTTFSVLFGHPTVRPCSYCPSFAVHQRFRGRDRVKFAYHFNNVQTDQCLSVNAYYAEQPAVTELESVKWERHAEYVVSDGCCCSSTTFTRTLRTPANMAMEVWFDALLFLDRRELEKCQLISKRFCGIISANSAKLAQRRITKAEVAAWDDQRFTVSLTFTPTPDSVEFTLWRSFSLSNLQDRLYLLLKHCSVELLVIGGDLNQLVASGLAKCTAWFTADELDVAYNVVASQEAVLAFVTQSVQHWGTRKLRHIASERPEQMLEPIITKRLTRLLIAMASSCQGSTSANLKSRFA